MKYHFFLGWQNLETVRIREVLTIAENARRPLRDYDPKSPLLNFSGARIFTQEQFRTSIFGDRISKVAEQGYIPVIFGHTIDTDLPEKTINFDPATQPGPLFQVLKLLKIDPTRQDKMIAANAGGGIKAMEAFQKKNDGQIDKGEIDEIRTLDREAMGITIDQDLSAVKGIENKQVHGNLIIVPIADVIKPKGTIPATNKWAAWCAVTDRLHEPDARPNILIVVENGTSKYFGRGDICEALRAKFNGRAEGKGVGEKFMNATCEVDKVDGQTIRDFIIELSMPKRAQRASSNSPAPLVIAAQ